MRDFHTAGHLKGHTVEWPAEIHLRISRSPPPQHPLQEGKTHLSETDKPSLASAQAAATTGCVNRFTTLPLDQSKMGSNVEMLASMPPDQQKYMAEAAKRKRPDGMAQFQELHFSDNERLRQLADDPFADHATLDQLPVPIKSGDRVKFLILGAGLGGILNGVRLIQAGFSADQIRLVEVAGGIGGTWYWNRYPGLHCDVESYVYLPLLEEMGYMPPHKYISGVGIRNYLVEMAKKWDLADKIMYRTQVNGLQWDDGIRAWKADMTTGRGPGGQEKSTLWMNADFVLLNTGLFPHPQVPKLPGLTGFEGAMFHTARWDYNVTGGSSETPFPTLDKLNGKRVGIIGTGATAIQVVPEVAKWAKELYVFQRTPSQVHVRGQRETDLTEWREQIAAKPGWQTERMENFAEHLSLGAPSDHKNLVGDGFSHLSAYYALIGGIGSDKVTPEKVPEHIGGLLALDATRAAKVRARVSEVVKDEDTAEKLTPWYPVWCKRPTFSDVFLQAFNQENVHLVDTDGKGVDGVTPRGLVFNGKEYPLDVLILSTGYRSPGVGSGNPSVRTGLEIVGRGGRTLTEKWTSQGPTTLHGCASNGFPNLFWMGPTQAGATANFAHVLEVLSRHVAHIVAKGHEQAGACKQDNGVVVEVRKEAEEAWSMLCLSGAAAFSATSVCTPSYLTNEGEAMLGKPQELMQRARGAPWPTGMVAYIRELDAWHDAGKLEGIEVTAA
ncbi:uncharacterized protein BCR38DRAFT_334696 [Pseudomassariella vexata]|uniref:FAD/NAD(P)-binding domain-containing protein n=1 Tax=Pseudomassariella vexata TaxID=1141098 RepID=A0A1Y2EA05_9PEZI|nr:uncharacterized protein BCR38DRAFT_334696 [Pseudomassariella vexata]ORY68389.1 hypothetical protein BCR38DRAFT_334696 [Pseudomassariella vexata]